MRTAVLTALALVAFASNSLLCRMALGHGDDRRGVVLDDSAARRRLSAWGSSRRRHGAASAWRQGSWLSAAILFVYAIPFSYAYGLLTAGTGALILFGTVQVTMIGARSSKASGLASGNGLG